MRICMNTALRRSGRVDDIKGYQQGKIRGLTRLVNLTEDVRRYAKENAIDESTAMEFAARQKISKKKHSRLVSGRKLANSSRKAANHISCRIHSEKVGNEIAASVVT